MNRMGVHECEEYLVSELKRLGFSIMRYHSMSTNSVYIKIDYGIAHSIRLSDHEGKKRLKYRYNVLTNSKKKNPHRIKEGRLNRYYFPPTRNGLDILVGLICGVRSRKIAKYGERNYKKYMEEAYKANRNNRGFWQMAEII